MGTFSFTRLRDEAVGADAEIGRAAGQQLRHVYLRAAFADGDVQPALGIQPFGQRLIEAAMFGLGLPVGDENDVSGRGQRRRHQKQKKESRKKTHIGL